MESTVSMLFYSFLRTCWNSVSSLKDLTFVENFDHNRNLYLLDYSLGLLIEIYSRDVSMSQPSTFISTAEEFISYISYKTWQYLLTHQGLLSPLSLRICGNYTLMLNTPTGWGLWTISVLVCSCFSFETRQLSDSLRDDHLSVTNMSKHAVLSCLDLSKLRE